MKLIKFIAILAFAFASGVAFAAAPGKVTVDSVDGTVLTIADGGAKPLAKGDVLTQGARIAADADSKVRIVLANGTVLVLTPNTEIIIAQFEQNDPAAVEGKDFDSFKAEPAETYGSLTTIQVVRGKVLFDVAKLLSSSRFVFKTAHGALQIKGTSGFVSTSETGSSFGLADGSATISAPGASSIKINGGQSVSVSSTGARSVAPVTRGMAAQIKEELEEGAAPAASSGAAPAGDAAEGELPAFPTLGGSSETAIENSNIDSAASVSTSGGKY